MECRPGSRSALAARMLFGEGYEALNLEGGMLARTGDGLPFEGRVV